MARQKSQQEPPDPQKPSVPAGPAPRPEAPGIPDDLQELLLGAPVRYARTEVADAARMTLDEVGRLWRAMGFPDAGLSRAFTDADLAALLRISGVMERGLLDLDSMVDIVRSFGQTSSRLAEWQLDTISRYLALQEEEGSEERARSDWERIARAQVAELLPELELLLAYVWRRQLTATLGRVFDEFEEPSEVSDSATVAFADLVGFTRLSRQLDQDSLARLVQTFETAASDIVHAAGGRLIKTLGDEVMFASDAAVVAAEIGLRLHDMSRAEPEMPQMRVGMATGAVLMRMGDVFGTTVNRASRLTATARPGSTLMDGATADALAGSQDDRFSVRAQTPRRIRGLGLMRPYALSRGARRLDDGEDQPTAASRDSTTSSRSAGNT